MSNVNHVEIDIDAIMCEIDSYLTAFVLLNNV